MYKTWRETWVHRAAIRLIREWTVSSTKHAQAHAYTRAHTHTHTRTHKRARARAHGRQNAPVENVRATERLARHFRENLRYMFRSIRIINDARSRADRDRSAIARAADRTSRTIRRRGTVSRSEVEGDSSRIRYSSNGDRRSTIIRRAR